MLDDAGFETWRSMGGVGLCSVPVIQGLSNVIQSDKDLELAQVHKALLQGPPSLFFARFSLSRIFSGKAFAVSIYRIHPASGMALSCS